MQRGLLSSGMDDAATSAYGATLATPEQVAEVAYFLAGPQAALINGASVVLDRGLTITR